MKKIWLLSSFCIISFMLTGCRETEIQNPTENDCKEEKCEITIDEPTNTETIKNLTAFGTEPFWDISISGNEAIFFEMGMEDYENKKPFPITIKNDNGNYHFFNTELEGKFEEKDCVEGGKWDTHYYTVEINYKGQKFQGCGDDERGVKFSEDDNYETNNTEIDISDVKEYVEVCKNTIPLEFSSVKENIKYLWTDKGPQGQIYQVKGKMFYEMGGFNYAHNIICEFIIGEPYENAFPTVSEALQ